MKGLNLSKIHSLSKSPALFLQASSKQYSTQTSKLGVLHGKKTIITGASRGIGLSIAERFAAEGSSLVLVARNTTSLNKLLSSLPSGPTQGHEIVAGDVGSEDFWTSNFRGRKDVDILVNAAGVTFVSPFLRMGGEKMEAVLRTNLMGTMFGCGAVGRGMLGRRDGCIVNVASLLGMKGGRGSAAYVASKAGVIGFTRALAAELGEKGTRVNVIVPGYIETDMTAAMTPEARSDALDAIPLKRFGEASDIADAAVFLATNKYANNCVLNLDGGLSAV
ncbi:NAD(P)-binding Rossmann-fold containing protein [Glarea lozoyensis ATCC 20868]|uniref:NAD(P)-binding Rossmann-fold containing protein n=1 Tax=Glarea lozoyensis (strain ATCC 20868 / MF5171) TaxID=1116229 RepID=S3CKM8_GLAL2|nr:NAD(P)-binding Rossmann-fold containing protein [Glarea lozoyensis ATCC 20868]EPE25754.1 NAD(P)-binding Rossmann-fold containing protein [Glarea lozoyensis ATCC 20868]